MVLLKDYESLEDTLLNLKLQVIESIPYVQNNFPNFPNPESLFYFLRERTTYRNDPTTRELLMTVETLMTGSRTGKPGAGDCDDFTILSLACLIANRFEDVKVILVGRKESHPTHIYVGVMYEGKLKIFDLTNSQYNYERKNYNYQQILDFKI